MALPTLKSCCRVKSGVADLKVVFSGDCWDLTVGIWKLLLCGREKKLGFEDFHGLCRDFFVHGFKLKPCTKKS